MALSSLDRYPSSWRPLPVRKYILRLFTLGECRMDDMPCSTTPSFSILLSIRDAYERVIPRPIPTPSCVISKGAPYDMPLST